MEKYGNNSKNVGAALELFSTFGFGKSIDIYELDCTFLLKTRFDTNYIRIV